MIKLLLLSNVWYFIFNLFIAVMKKGAAEYINSIFNIKSLIGFVIFNESPVGVHLWYLGAILYTIFIFGLFAKSNKLKIIYFAIPVLFTSGIILREYVGESYYVRNFLFIGIPFFGIGYFLKTHKDIMNKLSNKKISLIAVFVFAVCSVLERFVLVKLGFIPDRPIHFSSLFLSVSLFAYFSSINAVDNKVFKSLCDIGKNYSLTIYLLHPAVISTIKLFLNKLGSEGILIRIYLKLQFLFIFAVTLILAILFERICNLRKSSPRKSS